MPDRESAAEQLIIQIIIWNDILCDDIWYTSKIHEEFKMLYNLHNVSKINELVIK